MCSNNFLIGTILFLSVRAFNRPFYFLNNHFMRKSSELRIYNSYDSTILNSIPNDGNSEVPQIANKENSVAENEPPEFSNSDSIDEIKSKLLKISVELEDIFEEISEAKLRGAHDDVMILRRIEGALMESQRKLEMEAAQSESPRVMPVPRSRMLYKTGSLFSVTSSLNPSDASNIRSTSKLTEFERLMAEFQKSNLDIQKSTLDVKKSTLDVQKSTLDVKKSTLDVQKSTFKIEELRFVRDSVVIILVTLFCTLGFIVANQTFKSTILGFGESLERGLTGQPLQKLAKDINDVKKIAVPSLAIVVSNHLFSAISFTASFVVKIFSFFSKQKKSFQ